MALDKSKKRAVANISRELKGMKFMKRRKVLSKDELIQERKEIIEEQLKNTKILAVRNEEFWEVKLPEGLVAIYNNKGQEACTSSNETANSSNSTSLYKYKGRSIKSCSQKDCSNYMPAHQSFGKFNPEIEAFNKTFLGLKDIDESVEKTGTEDMDLQFDEQEMAYMLDKRKRNKVNSHRIFRENGENDAFENLDGKLEAEEEGDVAYSMRRKTGKSFRKPDNSDVKIEAV